MTKTAVILLLMALAVTGCAGLTPEIASRSGDAQLRNLKHDPGKGEQSAKEALRKLTQAWLAGDKAELAQGDPKGIISLKGPEGPSELDLTEEAVWIGKETIMIRASWSKDSVERSGSRATRRMTNFVFDGAHAMTLQAIEGENPFDPAVWRNP